MRTRRSADEERWADLADLALIISRELQYRGYTDERAVSLTQSEGMVMRYLLQGDPAAPSQVAAATGLQRTNLSTTLRGLEQKGLIQRQANPSDGRGVTVSATERGRSNYALVRREWATAVGAAAGASRDFGDMLERSGLLVVLLTVFGSPVGIALFGLSSLAVLFVETSTQLIVQALADVVNAR